MVGILEQLKVGNKLTFYELAIDNRNQKTEVVKKQWKVMGIYPHGVLMQDKIGIRRFYTLFDIKEAMKKPKKKGKEWVR